MASVAEGNPLKIVTDEAPRGKGTKKPRRGGGYRETAQGFQGDLGLISTVVCLRDYLSILIK